MRKLTDSNHLRNTAYGDSSGLRTRSELHQNAELSAEPFEWSLGQFGKEIISLT